MFSQHKKITPALPLEVIPTISVEELYDNDKATVYLHKKNGANIVVKKYKHPAFFQQELSIHQYIKTHPNLVKCIGLDSSINEISLEYAAKDTLVEYIESDRVPAGLVTAERLTIMKNVLSAIIYLHSIQVLHNDIKPDNILWFENNTFKIADFDLSVILQNGQKTYKSNEFMGTPDYSAPESYSINNSLECEYSFASDLWQFTVTFWRLLSKAEPYPDYNEHQLTDLLINKSQGTAKIDVQMIRNNSVRTLALQLFNTSPARRPGSQYAMTVIDQELNALTHHIPVTAKQKNCCNVQ